MKLLIPESFTKGRDMEGQKTQEWCLEKNAVTTLKVADHTETEEDRRKRHETNGGGRHPWHASRGKRGGGLFNRLHINQLRIKLAHINRLDINPD